MLRGNRFPTLSWWKSTSGSWLLSCPIRGRWGWPALESLPLSSRMLWSPGLALRAQATMPPVIPNQMTWRPVVETQLCSPSALSLGSAVEYFHWLIKAGFHFYLFLGYCFSLFLFFSSLLLILASTIPLSPILQDILTLVAYGACFFRSQLYSLLHSACLPSSQDASVCPWGRSLACRLL